MTAEEVRLKEAKQLARVPQSLTRALNPGALLLCISWSLYVLNTVLGTGMQKWKRHGPRPLSEEARHKNANIPSEGGYNSRKNILRLQQEKRFCLGKIHSRGDIRSGTWRKNGGFPTKEKGDKGKLSRRKSGPTGGKCVKKQAKEKEPLPEKGVRAAWGGLLLAQADNVGIRTGAQIQNFKPKLSLTGPRRELGISKAPDMISI